MRHNSHRHKEPPSQRKRPGEMYIAYKYPDVRDIFGNAPFDEQAQFISDMGGEVDSGRFMSVLREKGYAPQMIPMLMMMEFARRKGYRNVSYEGEEVVIVKPLVSNEVLDALPFIEKEEGHEEKWDASIASAGETARRIFGHL